MVTLNWINIHTYIHKRILMTQKIPFCCEKAYFNGCWRFYISYLDSITLYFLLKQQTYFIFFLFHKQLQRQFDLPERLTRTWSDFLTWYHKCVLYVAYFLYNIYSQQNTRHFPLSKELYVDTHTPTHTHVEKKIRR